MKLIIAEKPDQGLKLAAPYSFKKKDGFVEITPNDTFPKGAFLTWAIGHLCELIPPEEYDASWKKWKIDTLPIIPNKFQHRVMKAKWKQFKVIQGLVQNPSVSEIIIAGDAEREGEAIIRIILGQCRNHKPLKRLWISSLTENAVKQGFSNLLEEDKTRNLYHEALSRQCADWLIGMNASRVYTLLLQKKGIQDVFSVGRVQTPTLALIVKREKEIQQFTSKPFWEVICDFSINGKKYSGKWHKDKETRIEDEKMALAIQKFCLEKPATISSIEKERKEYLPPFLFNLSSLQATANKLYKFPPKKTLDIAQKLYVQGVISYPRSDSSFVTKEEANGFPDILNKLSKFKDFSSLFPLPKESIMNDKRYVNEKKVTDHYAIIPTEQVPKEGRLSGDDWKIYELIAKRLIAAHYPKAIFDYTTVHTLVDKRAEFITKGKEKIQDGWRKVLFEKESKEKDEEQDLPTLESGEEGSVKKAKVKKGETQPPKRYTEGQLITLMKTAGKHIEDQELQAMLNKTEGLGTEATRAGIIGILKDRGYISVVKNQVYATDKGMVLIEAVGKTILASPEMTAKWETRLEEIGDGNAAPSEFMNQVKKLSTKLIHDAIENEASWDFKEFDMESMSKTMVRKGKKVVKKANPLGKCPVCNGSIIDKGTFFGCSEYTKNQCKFTISKKMLGKSITQKNIRLLLKDGITEQIEGFKKEDKVFTARLCLREGKVSFQYG
ncbi:DNA topoisomerase III [Peribacillus acanthi]|uniref:DNA topoisomerase III n=1 Tax=Peribacillus acanthi TaxID=2171554 RepID=UPI000D3E57F6|nr:DNA topoisomerase III [Peribacillus acanthi]